MRLSLDFKLHEIRDHIHCSHYLPSPAASDQDMKVCPMTVQTSDERHSPGCSAVCGDGVRELCKQLRHTAQPTLPSRRQPETHELHRDWLSILGSKGKEANT